MEANVGGQFYHGMGEIKDCSLGLSYNGQVHKGNSGKDLSFIETHLDSVLDPVPHLRDEVAQHVPGRGYDQSKSQRELWKCSVWRCLGDQMARLPSL